jgi:hypothetical protein
MKKAGEVLKNSARALERVPELVSEAADKAAKDSRAGPQCLQRCQRCQTGSLGAQYALTQTKT